MANQPDLAVWLTHRTGSERRDSVTLEAVDRPRNRRGHEPLSVEIHGRSGLRSDRAQPAAEMIGLLAGSGRFPILFAEAAQRQGLQVACVGIKYEAPDELRALCTSFELVGVAKLGKMIRAFRRQGVKQVVMAGKVTKNVIYTPWRFVQLCPDLRTIQWWYRRSRADNRDDSLLLSVIDEFERDGMTFASALDYCPELLVKEGILTRRAPTAAERRTSSSAG